MTDTVAQSRLARVGFSAGAPVRACAACRRSGPVDGFVRLQRLGTSIALTRIGRWSGHWVVWPAAESAVGTTGQLATLMHCEHNTAPRLSAALAPTGGRTFASGLSVGGGRGNNVCARARCLHLWLMAAGRRKLARTAGPSVPRTGNAMAESAGRIDADGNRLAVTLADHIETMWVNRLGGLQRRGIEPQSDVQSLAWQALRDELRAAAQPEHRRPGDKRGRATMDHGARE